MRYLFQRRRWRDADQDTELHLCTDHGAGVRRAAIAQDDAAIEGVIRQQLDAFLAGDVDTAWGYASPEIQRLFGNPENFGRMVERGYPMVWAPGDVRFGRCRKAMAGCGRR